MPNSAEEQPTLQNLPIPEKFSGANGQNKANYGRSGFIGLNDTDTLRDSARNQNGSRSVLYYTLWANARMTFYLHSL